MRWISIAMGIVISASAAVSGQVNDSVQKGAALVLRGCVVPDPATGTLILKDATEVKGDGASALSTQSPVLYWFKDSTLLKGHESRMVEVASRVDGVERSEAELKNARAGGGLLIEIEGPGKDVQVSPSSVPSVTGTAGRAKESDDVKTLLIKATIGHVKEVEGTCR